MEVAPGLEGAAREEEMAIETNPVDRVPVHRAVEEVVAAVPGEADRAATNLNRDEVKNRAAFRQLCLFRKTLSVLREGHYIGSLQTFGAFLNGKLHLLFGFQLTVAIRLNGGEVHKHIITTIATNEAIALGGIEPFNGSNKAF
jgi:hypothetical protein